MPDWDMSELQAELDKRKRLGKAGPIDEVVLTYARWLQDTDAPASDRDKTQQSLDRQLDDIDPDRWADLKELVGLVDDRLLKEVMVYSGRRALEQLELARNEPDQDLDGPFPPPRSPSRKKTRKHRM